MHKKNIGVVYKTELDGPIIVYRACFTVDEAIDIIKNNEDFKKIEKVKVYIIKIIEDGEDYENIN